jgi:hypothetical protein
MLCLERAQGAPGHFKNFQCATHTHEIIRIEPTRACVVNERQHSMQSMSSFRFGQRPMPLSQSWVGSGSVCEAI